MEAPVWQGLMNSAYERWQTNLRMSYADFLFGLSGPERIAVLLGNLNYQVENGGFRQWVDNGYALAGRDVLRAVRTVIDAPSTTETEKAIGRELASRVRRVLQYVDQDAEPRGFGGDYWTDGTPHGSDRHRTRWEGDGDGDDGPGPDIADEQDDWYYANSDAWGAAVERFLTARTAPPDGTSAPAAGA